jgi:hypothetical protein
MVDPKGPVEVDTHWIYELGTKFKNWSRDLLVAHTESNGMKVTTGKGTTAFELTFDGQVSLVKGSLDNMQKGFWDAGDDLHNVSYLYTGVEDDNKDDANKVRILFGHLDKDFPGSGAGGALPPDPNAYPGGPGAVPPPPPPPPP